MRIAIMQPYFFPYAGYFSLIKHTDKFILLDDVQYIRHGWIERNRILNHNQGWIYIKVPLVKEDGRITIIKKLKINNDQEWKQKIISQLITYKKKAPYYKQVTGLINEVFNKDFDEIVSLNKFSLESVCVYLGLEHDIEVFSKMNLSIEKPEAPDEWALNICKAIGDVKEYWNPTGGQSFFDKNKYENAGIVLKFHKINLLPYDQFKAGFEPGLSIIDLMMFNPPQVINQMLDNYELE